MAYVQKPWKPIAHTVIYQTIDIAYMCTDSIH